MFVLGQVLMVVLVDDLISNVRAVQIRLKFKKQLVKFEVDISLDENE